MRSSISWAPYLVVESLIEKAENWQFRVNSLNQA
jgi:hypothetical protein